jgi:site-specific DNA recombinase
MHKPKQSPPHGTNGKMRVRCAIYTRKSTEEGLEQAFNSLDAQRETCEAYVLSQKHEGWSTLPSMYDDGGISGGTLDRPALKRLLADIAAGAIDTVVVYKVDRLTRSLADFAKIVDVFEHHGVTFVSVTQSFSTTTSMGRLTLNMLLSFAQFEREVAGERIRDKIAASKRKGIWMGGLPPLGYDVADRKLTVNRDEAETIRHIFRRYAELGSVSALQDDLDADCIVSKRRIDRFGRETGGKPLARGALYRMLQNRIYRGEIVHKEASYPGEHEPLVEVELWDTVQSRLAANRVARKTSAAAADPSLLASLVYDEAGERMSPTHAKKKKMRYRYYVSHNLIRRGRPKEADCGRRVPAGELERLVESRIVSFLSQPAAIFDAVDLNVEDSVQRAAMIAAAADLARQWPKFAPSERRALLQRLVLRIDLSRDAVEVRVRQNALQDLVTSTAAAGTDPATDEDAVISLTIPIQLRRVGKENRLLIDGADGARIAPDPSLARLLGQAHRFQDMVLRGAGRSIGDLAAEVGITQSYFTRVLRLSFLAPAIARTILDGAQPSHLSAKSLTAVSPDLAKDWTAQANQLGIVQP